MSISSRYYPALKAEIETDPQNFGYAGKTRGEQARILNLVRSIVIDIDTLSRKTLQASVVGSEYLQLSEAQRALWSSLLSSPEESYDVDIRPSNILGQIDSIWPSGSGTMANIVALRSTPEGTRAEQILGFGTIISHRDIKNAFGV